MLEIFKKYALAQCFILLSLCAGFAQTGTIKGRIIDESGRGIDNVSILLMPSGKGTVTDAGGSFIMSNVSAGAYTVTISHIAYQKVKKDVTVQGGKTTDVQVSLVSVAQTLGDIEVVARRTFETFSFLPQVEGADVFAGKKTEVVHLQELNANLAENLPRQIFAKVPGVMVWEMDGTGNQVGVATRGLIPHRSWELHIQQNGNTTNSDLFGYPESHYNPPMEAVGAVRIVRGSGALQYGPQFGGLLEYQIKTPDTTRKIGFETQQTVGSFGLFGSFNAIGGKVGKLTYYGYYNFRRSDGWRENSDYHFNAWHGSVAYDLNSDMRLSAEFSHMEYINHFAAGLTDELFEEDPQYSNRPRNYFNPTIYIPAIHYDWKISPKTYLAAKVSGIFGERNSVQFITVPTVDDTINAETNTYNPRQVDRDYYHSYSAEVKLRHSYPLLGNESHLSGGVRYNSGDTDRRQKGLGTTSTEFDLSLISPYRIDLNFRTHNYALFAENVFNLTDKLSVTPGFRYEIVNTEMSGRIDDQPALQLPFSRDRSFALFGAGIEYQVTSALQVYGNFTQNFRPILHSDLIPPTDLDRIDPDLEDAKGNNTEIGIRGRLDDVLQYDVNYFRLQYDNRIGVLIENGQTGTTFFHTNIGDMVNQGVEWYLEFHPLNLGAKSRRDMDLSIFSSTAMNSAEYTRGTVRVNGENQNIEGNTVENVPDWISRNGVTFTYGKFATTLQLSYVSENFSDALNTVSTANGVNGIVPSYLITDWNFSYAFGHRYTVQLAISNLTDEAYYTRRATGYPGPGILPSDGRSVLVSFGAKF